MRRWNSASSKSEAKDLLRFNWAFCAGLEAMARSIAFSAAALLPWRRLMSAICHQCQIVLGRGLECALGECHGACEIVLLNQRADPANYLEATRDTQDATQLDERLLVVVDTDVEQRVVVVGANQWLDDLEHRALHAAAVAACSLAGIEGSNRRSAKGPFAASKALPIS